MPQLSRDGSEMKQLICSFCNETEVSASHFICLHSETFFFFKSRAYTTCLVWSLWAGENTRLGKTISIFYNQLCF